MKPATDLMIIMFIMHICQQDIFINLSKTSSNVKLRNKFQRKKCRRQSLSISLWEKNLRILQHVAFCSILIALHLPWTSDWRGTYTIHHVISSTHMNKQIKIWHEEYVSVCVHMHVCICIICMHWVKTQCITLFHTIKHRWLLETMYW